jgi:uncharacterized protein HemY
LWGKARSYFEASLSVEETFGATLALARLLEETGEHEAAQMNLLRSLALAEPLIHSDPVRRISGSDVRAVSRQQAVLPPPP